METFIPKSSIFDISAIPLPKIRFDEGLWTTFTLIITTFLFSKWYIFFDIIKNKKYLIYLFFSGLLIFINWAVWIYAIATNRIIDASFGYFIMPILSVFLGYVFYDEKINQKILEK